jgi:glycine hydroxymethyltransferase
LSAYQKTDPLITSLLEQERLRQQATINLIASENYAPVSVTAPLGSSLINKYAEGTPGKRYYAGCEVVDTVETLAIERCAKLFGAEHANVQPHAGSQANQATYLALLKPGDAIMGMSLSAGGHLTHGHKVNFSGVFYRSIQYTVDRDTQLIDYEAVAQLAQEHKPKIIIAGTSSYSRTIDFARFAEIAQSVDAKLVVDMAHIAGLIAAKLHPDPVPHADLITSTTHKTLRGPRGAFILSKQAYATTIDKAVMPGIQGGPFMDVIASKAVCFELAAQPEFFAYQKQVIANAQRLALELNKKGWRIVSAGTDTHLFVVDLEQKFTGREAEALLEQIGITTSRSMIPFDPQPPLVTSGIRLGTPAMTTRGMGQAEMDIIAHLIDQALTHRTDEHKLATLSTQIRELALAFPVPT